MTKKQLTIKTTLRDTNLQFTIKRGFTLIELLVVISIIGVLAVLVIANLNEARVRARDSSKKQNLVQLKTGLQLYYSDFKGFPASTLNNGAAFYACGTTGTSACTPDGAFSAGSGPTIYLSRLVKSGSYYEFKYYPCNSGDSFRAKVTLENASDPDIAASKLRCPANTCTLPAGGNPGYDSGTNTDYVVCD